MRHVLLLRGVNLGPNRRVPMAELRAALTGAGYGEVRTYVQSGNVVLDPGGAGAGALESEAQRLIAERFGLDVPVIARSRDELAAVVALDPLAGVATDPKRYQVSFLADPVAPDVLARLQAAAAGDERLVAEGRELYAWHPEGVARSKLALAVADKRLGATARNWSTVTTLLAMADA